MDSTRGKKTVLPGLWSTGLDWLSLMQQRGVLDHSDAVGVPGFPSTTEVPWRGWSTEIGDVRKCLTRSEVKAEIWITQAGFSTWRGGEREQVGALIEAANAPVERMYWYGAHDNHPRQAAIDSFHSDEREYHYGLKRADGRPKLLFDIWSEGGWRQ